MCGDDGGQRHRGMIHEPCGAEQPRFFALVRNEDDRTLRRLGRKLLGNFQQHDGAGAIVVGAVEDRVAARRTHAACGSDQRVDALLLLCRRHAGRIVGALRTRDRVHRAQRVVIHGDRAGTNVIVVCPDQHVFRGERRIGTRQHRDDVARRRCRRRPCVCPGARHRRTDGADVQLLHAAREELRRNSGRDGCDADAIRDCVGTHGRTRCECRIDRGLPCCLQPDDQHARSAGVLRTRVTHTTATGRTTHWRAARCFRGNHRSGAEHVRTCITTEERHGCTARRAHHLRCRCRAKDHDLAANLCGIQCLARIAPASAKHCRHVLQIRLSRDAHRGRRCHGNPILFHTKCRAAHAQARRAAVEAHGPEWQHLKVRAAVTRRLQAEPAEFTCDVLCALHVAGLADAAALHGVVRELVKSRAKVVCGDLRLRRSWRPCRRPFVRPDRAS